MQLDSTAHPQLAIAILHFLYHTELMIICIFTCQNRRSNIEATINANEITCRFEASLTAPTGPKAEPIVVLPVVLVLDPELQLKSNSHKKPEGY